jgi:hypothetical protein
MWKRRARGGVASRSRDADDGRGITRQAGVVGCMGEGQRQMERGSKTEWGTGVCVPCMPDVHLRPWMERKRCG